MKITFVESSEQYPGCYDVLIDGTWLMAREHDKDPAHQRMNSEIDLLENLRRHLDVEIEVKWSE